MKTKTRRAQQHDEFTAEDRAFLAKMQALSPDNRVTIKAIIDAFFTQLETAASQESAKIIEGLALSYPACGDRRIHQRRVLNVYNPSDRRKDGKTDLAKAPGAAWDLPAPKAK